MTDGRRTTADGIELHLRDTGQPAGGDGEAPVVVFLHGVPTSSFLYRKVLDELRDEARCVAPDLPGFGRSEASERTDQTLGGMARTIGALLDELVPPPAKVHLVVHDVGGAVGLIYATRHPERLASLLILDTTLFAEHFRPPPIALVGAVPWFGVRAVEHGLTEAAFTFFLRRAFEVPLSDEVLEGYWAPYRERATRRTLGRVFSGYRRSVLDVQRARAGLGRITVPTTVCFAEDDPFCPPANARRFAQAIPGSRLRLLEGTGHFVPEERPDVVADEVRRLLRRAGAAAASAEA